MKIFNAAYPPVQNMIKYVRLSERFIILLFVVGCSSSVFASVYPFSGTYSRNQVVPSVDTAAEIDGGNGTITGTYNDVTRVINYTINFVGISRTMGMNFHAPGAFGANGPVIFADLGFPVSAISGVHSNSFTISAAQEIQLKAGLWYSNIRTYNLQNGEIRAQIILGKAGESCSNNLPPIFTICPTEISNAENGEPIIIRVAGYDPDGGQTLGLEVVDFPFGPFNVTGLSNPFVREFTWTPTGNPSLWDGTGTGIFRLYDNCGGERFCDVLVNVDAPIIDMFSCQNMVVVNQNTTINFNTTPPTYTGDPDLQPYFTWDKSGPTPDTWKAIFNVGNKALQVLDGATLTTALVNGFAPGIVIKSSVCLSTDVNTHIIVSSLNQNAGDIIIEAGDVYIAGEIRNEVKGTNGLAGAIKVTSASGLTVDGLVQIFGVKGGNTISLITCDELNNKMNNGHTVLGKIGRGASSPGDSVLSMHGIFIYGLIKSYTKSYTGDQNSPNIKIASFKGNILIKADSPEPLYDDFLLNGSKFDLWGGLLSWVGDNVMPGKIEVQSNGSITVFGHGDDPTGPARKSFGAIAAVGTASDAPGGIVDVRAKKMIVGSGRAFDVSGRNRLITNYAKIRLWADGVYINHIGRNNSFNPVVDASSPVAGDRAGMIDLRACGYGNIYVREGAIVSAKVPPGNGSVQGTNQLTSSNPIYNFGTVTPAYITGADCSTPLLFADCAEVNSAAKSNYITGVPEKKKTLQIFPNPFKQTTTISYELTTKAHVTLKIFNTLGKEIAVIVDEEQIAGQHHTQWNAKAQSGEIYFVSLKIGDKVETERLITIK